MSSPGIEHLSAPRRWGKALRALTRLALDSDDTQAALEFGIHLNAGRIGARVGALLDHPDGRRLFAERRTLDRRTVDLGALARLPPDTLGGAYARFMQRRGLTPRSSRCRPGWPARRRPT
jgi:ubiquinone biosynthesis protein Coq4